MKTIYYQLYHEYTGKHPEEDDIYKLIGVFSSCQKAKEAINYLIKQPGFNKFHKNNFKVYKAKIDRYGWKEGFCTWKEANEYQQEMEVEK